MRTYSNAFLKKHPKLSVRLMALALSPTGLADGVKNSAGNFALRLSIELKKSPVNSTLGFCKTKGSGFSCNLESDGGSIRITRVGRDLRITSNRIEIEGNGFGDNDLSLTAPAGQTRSFLLKRATTTQCDQAFD